MSLKVNSVSVLCMLLMLAGCSKKSLIDVHLFGKKIGCSTCFVAKDVNYDYMSTDLENKIKQYGDDISAGLSSYVSSNPSNFPAGYEAGFTEDYLSENAPISLNSAKKSIISLKSSTTPTRQTVRADLISALKASDGTYSCSPDFEMLLMSKYQSFIESNMENEAVMNEIFMPAVLDCAFFTSKAKLNVKNGDLNNALDVNFSYYEILALRSDNQVELKEYKTMNSSSTTAATVTSEQIASYQKKKARREFLQVFTNAVMANTSNLFAFLTYAGGNATLFESNNQLESFFKMMGFNTVNLSQIYATNKYNTLTRDQLFEGIIKPNKPAFYLFLEKLFLEKDMDYVEATQKITYKIDPVSLCKVFSGNTGSSTDGVQAVVGANPDCLRFIQYYLVKVSIAQDISNKKIDIDYFDPARMSAAAKFLTANYTYNYEASLSSNLNDYQKIAVAFAESEYALGDDKTINASASNLGSVDAEDIKYLKALTVQGTLAAKNYVETEGNQDPEKIVDVSKVTLKSYTKIDITKDLLFKVPDGTTVDRGYYDYLLSSNTSNNDGISVADINKEGEIELKLPARPGLIRIDHTRANTLYGDELKIDLNYLDLKFPPYQFTSTELLSFGAGYYPVCSTANCQNVIMVNKQAIKDASKLAHATYTEFSKTTPDFDKINYAMTDADLNLVLVKTFDVNNKMNGREISDFNMGKTQIHVDTDLNLPGSTADQFIDGLGTSANVKNADITFRNTDRFTAVANYSNGSISGVNVPRSEAEKFIIDIHNLEMSGVDENNQPVDISLSACNVSAGKRLYEKEEFVGQADPVLVGINPMDLITSIYEEALDPGTNGLYICSPN